MGNAPTKIMSAAAFPTTVVPPLNQAPARRIAYRLPITFTVMPFEEDAPLEHEHVQEALGIAFFTGVWQPYLHNAMEEAWLLYANEGKDGEKDEIVGPCPELNTKCTLIVLEKTAAPGVYRGFVCWKSRAVPLEFVQRTLEWHVGDRMSSYEIQSEADDWMANISIGYVACD